MKIEHMKKTLSFWVCLLFFLLALTSCGFRNSQEGITVRLSGWQSNPNEKQLLEQVFNQFEIQHPNIKVKHETINDQYMDVIKTRLIGDAAPDVFYLDAFEAPLLMQYGVLEPLNSYINPEFNLNDFEPTLLKAFQLEDRIYGLPKDFSTLALFYNKKAFQSAGIDQAPKTWNELREASQKLTLDQNRDGRKEQYGFGIAPELSRQYFMMTAFGGRLIDRQENAAFFTSESLKGLQLIIEQYRKDQSSAQPSDVGASTGSEMFGQGKAAMVIEGTWAIPYLQETFPQLDFATTEVPTVNGEKGTMAYTVAYVMNKKTKHKEAAWKLIAYLTNQEGMKAWAKEGLALPARKSVLEELGYVNNSLYVPFVKGADYATIWQAGETLPTILTHFNNQFISALIGEQSLRQAMKKAQRSANKEIQAAR
ncbi:carbohydrate ABC transporter substrate-binding protein, CUT1 family [Allocoleopsis franciscana PCC 7113]|uniref:Carbohydrate ABC transporter substrate-binding protein, CUT1 family n=2 Tax=Allocoleopsis TaxID=2886347 RepID=K9WGD6_9CYAN|nr:carbohydrate ABC transporter substrate-binding protein, CUT1 family [Allocoleopsis franciscana PCC 7113]